MEALTIINNPAENRFETSIDGQLAKVEYRLMGDRKIALVHTEVPDELSGRGIAGQLAKFSLEYAHERGLSVLPYCPYIAAYLKRHPEYLDVVDPKFK